MKKEFNLSEKINRREGMLSQIYSHDVKEFIRLLKEKMCVCPHEEYSETICSNCTEIDQLAGDELI